MRCYGVLVAAILGSTLLALEGLGERAFGQSAQNQSASATLKAARIALGGESKLAAVNSLIMRGENRRPNQLYGVHPDAKEQYSSEPIEIRVLLPDNYFKMTLSGGYPWRTGFSGKDLIYEIDVPGDHKVASFVSPEMIDEYRTELARLMLLMLLRTDTVLPAKLHDSSESSTRLEFNGVGEFPVIVNLDAMSHLPKSLNYQVRIHTKMSGPPTGESINAVMTVDDWREVNGLQLPHHLLETSGGSIRYDIHFQSIEINPPLKPSDFKKK